MHFPESESKNGWRSIQNKKNINLECKLLKTVKLKSNTRKFSTMVMGEVIGIYIKDSFIEKGRVNSAAMRYVARMGYAEYTTVSSKFKMKSPNY